MGFLDNAGVDRVWKKFKEQLSNYLPLTGGTMKGLLNVPYGTAVHYNYGIQNSDGYVHLATIVIKTGYTNAPIELTITRRGDSKPTKIVVQFDNTDHNDPPVGTFSVFGATADVWMHKSSVSTWELYVKKNDWFDEVDVIEYHNPVYNNITVTWQKDQISTLPDGAVQATVGELYDADANVTFPKGVNAKTFNGHTVDADVPSDAKFTDTTYTEFQGTEGTHDGVAGLVPAPKKSEFGASYGLGSDGTWRDFGQTFVSQSFADGEYATNKALENAIEELKKYVDKQSPGGVTLDSVYPIGSVYISANGANPNVIIGGTWEEFATGRTLIGYDPDDDDLTETGMTGGEKTHTLTIEEMPSHNHSASTGGAGKHKHTVGYRKRQDAYGKGTLDAMHWITGTASTIETSEVANHSHTVTVESTGSGTAHNNMMPYITVRMWKRTA